jgi:hypothetical protein
MQKECSVKGLIWWLKKFKYYIKIYLFLLNIQERYSGVTLK